MNIKIKGSTYNLTYAYDSCLYAPKELVKTHHRSKNDISRSDKLDVCLMLVILFLLLI